jgi:DNA-binding protein Fis
VLQNGGGNGSINLSSLNVAEAERVLIQHALTASGNNRTKAADLLGISVRTLRNKLNGPGRDVEGDSEEE